MKLTFAGIILITGFAVAGSAIFAQSPNGNNGDAATDIPSMLTDGSMGLSVSEIMIQNAQTSNENQGEQPNDPEPTPITEPVFELPTVDETAGSEVNLETAESLDKLGRYPPRLRINFSEYPLRSLSLPKRAGSDPQEMSADVTSSDAKALLAIVSRIRNRLRLPHVNLVVEDRTAIVSGTVTTERERSMTELMLRFEPGIDSIQNRLTVVPVE